MLLLLREVHPPVSGNKGTRASSSQLQQQDHQQQQQDQQQMLQQQLQSRGQAASRRLSFFTH